MKDNESFRQFIERLRNEGELIDFRQPVDIRHIATLVDQSDKAIMFHHVIGYDIPVVSGIIRSQKRVIMSMGCQTYQEIEGKLQKPSIIRSRRRGWQRPHTGGGA